MRRLGMHASVDGEPLVTACAQAGTDYVDLCGEPGWMALVRRLEARAGLRFSVEEDERRV